jgi:fluoride exporter
MTFSTLNILAVGIGGALGAIGRFYIGIQVTKYFPHDLPLATLLVNIFGSFTIGILVALFLSFTPAEYIKAFLITGFLGALTTYSTFAIESFVLLSNNFWYGVLNIVLNVVGTITAAMIGYKLISS